MKPSAAQIRCATPLTKKLTRGQDPITHCNLCGTRMTWLTLWREHDEHDEPLPGDVALLFVGAGDDHVACRRALDQHPRLYVEESGEPGTFPSLCGPCRWRSGTRCTHPDLRGNGGEGLRVQLTGLRVTFCRRTGCDRPVRHATGCAGQQVIG